MSKHGYVLAARPCSSTTRSARLCSSTTRSMGSELYLAAIIRRSMMLVLMRSFGLFEGSSLSSRLDSSAFLSRCTKFQSETLPINDLPLDLYRTANLLIQQHGPS